MWSDGWNEMNPNGIEEKRGRLDECSGALPYFRVYFVVVGPNSCVLLGYIPLERPVFPNPCQWDFVFGEFIIIIASQEQLARTETDLPEFTCSRSGPLLKFLYEKNFWGKK